jgi:hypothetical protein
MESSSYRRYHWFQMALIVAGITTFAFAIPGCGTPGVERVDGTVERDYTIYVNSSAFGEQTYTGKTAIWRSDIGYMALGPESTNWSTDCVTLGYSETRFVQSTLRKLRSHF